MKSKEIQKKKIYFIFLIAISALLFFVFQQNLIKEIPEVYGQGDTEPPKVTLISPDDNYELEGGDLDIKFKQIDNIPGTYYCALYLDGGLYDENNSVLHDTETIFTVSGLKPGTHFWTVKCVDSHGNTGSPYYIIFGSDRLYQSDDDGITWTEPDILKYLKLPDPNIWTDTYSSLYGLNSLDSNGQLFMSFDYYNCYHCSGVYHACGSGVSIHKASFKRNSESPVFQMIGGNCMGGSPDLIYSLDEAFNGDLYAASSGIYKSSDKGGTWTHISGTSGSYSVTVAPNGYIFGASTNGVYRSIDNGQSFELLAESPITSEFRHTGSSIISANNNDIYVAGKSGVYNRDVWKSDDNGDTWNKVFTISGAWGGISSLYAYNETHIFAGAIQSDSDYGAIYRSTDAGASWEISLKQQQIKDETGAWEGWSESFDKAPNGDIYASFDNQGLLYRSSDTGASWELVYQQPCAPSNGLVLVDVVENVHRSFTIPTWPQIGKDAKHTGYTFLTGSIIYVDEKWNNDVGAQSYANVVTADINSNGKDEIVALGSGLNLFDGEGNLLWGDKKCAYWFGSLNCDGLTPAIGDVDGDGSLEVIIFSRAFGLGEIICRDANTGQLEWQRNQSSDGFPISGDPIVPVIADLNNDGAKEIILQGSKLYILNGADGSVLWTKDINHQDGFTPAVADLNGDGILDIITKADSANTIYALNGIDGTELWQKTVVSDFSSYSGHLTVANIGGSNTPDVIEINADHLYALDGDNGSELWRDDSVGHAFRSASVAVGDIDNDGKLELVVPFETSSGFKVVNGEDGSLVWQDTSTGAIHGSPAIVDIDNNGSLDIIVQSSNGVYAFDASGTLLWIYSVGGKSSVAVADVDGDNEAEVIVVSGGKVYVLDSDGNPPIVIISREPSGEIYDNDTITFTSTAADPSGIYYHAIQHKINEGEWTTISECYDGNGDNQCDGDPSKSISPLQGVIDPYTYNAGDNIEYRSLAVDNNIPPNTGYSAEESFIVLSGNNSPEAQDLIIDAGPTYCGIAAGQGQINFKWTYYDEDGGTQSRFDFRINDVDDVNNLNPEVDRRFCSDSNTQMRIIISSLVSSPHTYCCLAEDNLDCSGIYTVDVPDALTYYSTPYYWWIRVWDSEGASSGWVSGPFFTTTSHAWPWLWPGFTLDTSIPVMDEVIQLCAVQEDGVCESDISVCYDADNNEISCSGGTFFWNISDCNGIFVEGTDETSENPKVKLYSSGAITLYITDKDGLGPCSSFQDIEPKLPYPGWKEIPPR